MAIANYEVNWTYCTSLSLSIGLSDISKNDKGYMCNSFMLKKASRAAFALSSMLDNTVSATTINKLFDQLVEPILLYGVEQWMPYIHPRKVAQVGMTATFAAPNTQLSMEKYGLLPLFPTHHDSCTGGQNWNGKIPYIHPCHHPLDQKLSLPARLPQPTYPKGYPNAEGYGV